MGIEKEIVVQKTDKGGDLALNTPENYSETLRPHFESDPEMSWGEHSKLESIHCALQELQQEFNIPNDHEHLENAFKFIWG
mgnify:CR=1 FL=1